MKNIIALLLLSISLAAGQSFSLSTNLFFTNTIQSSVTLTYTGTNCLDVSRYKSFAVVATGMGTNDSTNTIAFSFKASADNTNYDLNATYTLSGTIYGTNRYFLFTNLTVGDGVGYVKPYQIVSSVTNTITNAWTYGATKTYPRN
jgi:hypothetical protein